jgi:hypothetical protein
MKHKEKSKHHMANHKEKSKHHMAKHKDGGAVPNSDWAGGPFASVPADGPKHGRHDPGGC